MIGVAGRAVEGVIVEDGSEGGLRPVRLGEDRRIVVLVPVHQFDERKQGGDGGRAPAAIGSGAKLLDFILQNAESAALLTREEHNRDGIRQAAAKPLHRNGRDLWLHAL